MHRIHSGAVALTATACVLCFGITSAHALKFTNFDVPSAKGTYPYAINDNNEVTGNYQDQSLAFHGFVRTSDGTISSFDPRGASTDAGLGTTPTAINAIGEIAGYYLDSSVNAHGFVRAPDGTITKINAPGATSTWVFSMNDKGQLTGTFRDSSGTMHAFLTKKTGRFVVFDVTGSLGYGNTSINKNAFVTGSFCTATYCYSSSGYVRDPQGVITTFEVTGAQKTIPAGINSIGTIAGYYGNNSGGGGGFVRSSNGQIATFDIAGHVTGLNNRNWVSGFTADPIYPFYHGFVREPDGTMLTLDNPKSGQDNGEGTRPFAINSRHYVTGSYIDSNGISHGFIVHPHS